MATYDPDIQQALSKALASGAPVSEALQMAEKVQTQRREPGIIRSLLTPFERAGKAAGAATFEGVVGLIDKYGRSKGLIPQNAPNIRQTLVQADNKTPMKNPFMDERTLTKMSDPRQSAVETAKTLLGLASYAVPYGKGANILTRSVVPGAVSAGMFEAGRPGATMQDVERSAKTGAVVAPVVSHVMPGVWNKIKGSGRAARSSVINPQVKASPTFFEKQKEMVDEAIDFGFKGHAKDQAKMMADKYRSLIDDLGIAAQESPNTFSASNLKKAFEGTLKLNADLNRGVIKQNLQFWKGKIGRGTMTTRQMLDLMFELQNKLDPAFRKIKAGNPLTDKEEVMHSLWQVVNSEVRSQPTLAGILDDMSALHELAPGYLKSTQAKARLPIPLTGFGVPIPNTIPQATKDAYGRAVSTVNELLGKMSQNLPTDPAKLAVLISAARSQGGQDTGQFQDMPLPVSPQATENRAAQLGLTPETMAIASITLSPTEFTKLKNAYEYLSGGDQSAAMEKRQMILKQAAPVIAQVAESAAKAPSGVVGSALALLGRIPGVEGGEAEFLRRDTEGYARLIASAFASEAGVATDKDVERWQNLMPRPGDTPAERQRQINKLLTRIKAEAQSLNMPVPQEILMVEQQLMGAYQ